MADDTTKDNVFDKMGITIKYGDVQVGETYPIYGAITKIENDTPGNVRVVVNYNIHLLMNVEELDKIDTLKNRAFEPAIFVAKITEIGATVRGECTTVVFGKQPDSPVQ